MNTAPKVQVRRLKQQAEKSKNERHHTYDLRAHIRLARQESMALHTMSQEDGVHLLRELYHS